MCLQRMFNALPKRICYRTVGRIRQILLEIDGDGTKVWRAVRPDGKKVCYGSECSEADCRSLSREWYVSAGSTGENRGGPKLRPPQKAKVAPTRPFAFTEDGTVMAGSGLDSDRAVEVSIYVVGARLRACARVAGTRSSSLQNRAWSKGRIISVPEIPRASLNPICRQKGSTMPRSREGPVGRV